MEIKRKPPNPNGNPNFRSRWDKLGETSTVRLPETLHATFKNLASAINEGKIKVSDLENQITGKPSLTIVPDPVCSKMELLEKLEQFEDEHRKSWGSSPNQRGEFKTTSRDWTKFHEFKTWIKEQN